MHVVLRGAVPLCTQGTPPTQAPSLANSLPPQHSSPSGSAATAAAQVAAFRRGYVEVPALQLPQPPARLASSCRRRASRLAAAPSATPAQAAAATTEAAVGPPSPAPAAAAAAAAVGAALATPPPQMAQAVLLPAAGAPTVSADASAADAAAAARALSALSALHDLLSAADVLGAPLDPTPPVHGPVPPMHQLHFSMDCPLQVCACKRARTHTHSHCACEVGAADGSALLPVCTSCTYQHGLCFQVHVLKHTLHTCVHVVSVSLSMFLRRVRWSYPAFRAPALPQHRPVCVYMYVRVYCVCVYAHAHSRVHHMHVCICLATSSQHATD